MAIIGKIRDNGWLVLVFIGLALLAFIFTDWSRMSGGGVESKTGIGTVYGEKVDQQEFNTQVNIAQQNADFAAQRQRQQSQPVDQSLVWRSFVEGILLNKEYEALGIDVSPTELDAYLFATDGFDPIPQLAQQFVDSATQQFDAQLLQQQIELMETSENAEDRERWEQNKEYYINRRKEEKYMALLEMGMYPTTLEAKNEYLVQKEIKSVSFVVKRYRDIKDEDIKVSDENLKKYYEENKTKAKYANKIASREVRFFDLPIKPSSADSTAFNEMMANLKGEFETAEDDSSFVLANSDFRFYTSGPYSTALPKSHEKAQQHISYPNVVDTSFENATLGQIVGPYENDGAQVIAKVIGFTSDTINARHILLPVEEGNETAAEELADSLLGILNGDNFAELAEQYSTDPGSKVKGGDLGDFFFSTMVQPFAIYCAEKPIGEIGKVRSQFGIHLIQVMERKGRKYPRLAMIQKTMNPSQDTKDAISNEVYDALFEIDSELAKKATPAERVAWFDTLASRKGYFSRPASIPELQPKLYGFTTKYAEDKIFDLAFNEKAQVGDLISSPIKDKDRYIIAILGAIRPEGIPNFEDVQLAMKADYIKDEKAVRLEKEFGSKDISSLKEVQKAELTLANPQMPGVGQEQEVVGAAFSGLKDGEQSLPIKGNSGVYLIKVDKTTSPTATEDYETEKTQLKNAMKGNLASEAKKALNKRANVVDNRRLFNIGVRR